MLKIVAMETLLEKKEKPTENSTKVPFIHVRSEEILKGPSEILGNESDLKLRPEKACITYQRTKSPLTILGSETDLKIFTDDDSERDDSGILRYDRPNSPTSDMTDSCGDDTLDSSSPRLTISEGNAEVVQEILDISEDVKPQIEGEQKASVFTHEDDPRLQCHRCFRKYTYLKSYQTHKCKPTVRSHKFTCTQCPALYTKSQTLRAHEQVKHREYFEQRQKDKMKERMMKQQKKEPKPNLKKVGTWAPKNSVSGRFFMWINTIQTLLR